MKLESQIAALSSDASAKSQDEYNLESQAELSGQPLNLAQSYQLAEDKLDVQYDMNQIQSLNTELLALEGQGSGRLQPQGTQISTSLFV